MNTLFVYLMMLKPAILVLLIAVAVPVALGLWLYPLVKAQVTRSDRLQRDEELPRVSAES